MSEDLNKKLEEYKKKQDEYLAGWQRARADFLNYKKEEIERMGEFLMFANVEFILKILPVLDSLELAEKNLLDKNSEDAKGFLQIKVQLQDFLKNQGVEEIKSLGEKFDPNFHEAVEEAEGEEAGRITGVVQEGYKLHNKVIRPAKVKVVK